MSLSAPSASPCSPFGIRSSFRHPLRLLLRKPRTLVYSHRLPQRYSYACGSSPLLPWSSPEHLPKEQLRLRGPFSVLCALCRLTPIIRTTILFYRWGNQATRSEVLVQGHRSSIGRVALWIQRVWLRNYCSKYSTSPRYHMQSLC